MSGIGDSNGHADRKIITDQHATSETNDDKPEIVLQNPVVLDLIFDHLPKKNWKSARLVNKTWHSTLQLRWRDQFFYNLRVVSRDTDKFPVAAFTADLLEQEHPTNNPNDLFGLDRHPIRNIYIRQYWGNGNDYIPQHQEHSRFWEIFGGGLKRIHLDEIRIPERAFLKRLLFELTPNLEEFSYGRCICDDIDPELNTVMEYTPPAITQRNLKYLKLELWFSPFPISWIELLSVFPNLKKFNLGFTPCDSQPRPSYLLKFFGAIDIIRKANHNDVLKINQLEIDALVGESLHCVGVIQFQSLFSSLPISILQVDTSGMWENEIFALVQALKSTLRELTLVDSSERSMYRVLPYTILPQGIRLTKLRAWGFLFSSLEILSCTPNLEELVLQNIANMLQPEVCGNLTGVAPLTKLKRLRYINYHVPIQQMDLLVKLMPNVKRIECTVDANGFRGLCRGWIDLEHLKVSLLHCDSEDFFIENLIQLQRLRSLKIDSRNDIEILGKSVFEAFLRMPSLTKIQLPSYAQITEECRHALKGKLVQIGTNYYY